VIGGGKLNILKEDVAIIEQALKVASKNSSDYEEISQYESVLQKLKSGSTNAQHDGFRYDYDDNMQ
jgi:hypothetical protein